jgi:hypothetical protein
MKKLGPVLGVLLSTAVFLVLLIAFDPFSKISDLLDFLFGALPKWTQVQDMYRNPETQEISHGDDPVPALQSLAQYWSRHPEAKRVLFIGNSQMYSITLAPGEDPPTGPEKTYVDLVADEVMRAPKRLLVYRFSAGGMSYPEALWFIQYVCLNPSLRPNYVFLQTNYQFFWTGGIRSGMLSMLEEPQFREQIETRITSGEFYAGGFKEALKAYQDMKARQVSAPSGSHGGSGSAAASPANFGYRLETSARLLLDSVPGFARRAAIRDSFTKLLYHARLYFLRITPSTARSITGARLLSSRASIEAIARLCNGQHVKLVLFNAPVNPNVSLYRTSADRNSYHQFLTGITEQFNIPLYDFEDTVPSEYWGSLLNGPDPLHMGRKGHQILAGQILDALRTVTATSVTAKGS